MTAALIIAAIVAAGLFGLVAILASHIEDAATESKGTAYLAILAALIALAI